MVIFIIHIVNFNNVMIAMIMKLIFIQVINLINKS
jgi:hypothetical protein